MSGSEFRLIEFAHATEDRWLKLGMSIGTGDTDSKMDLDHSARFHSDVAPVGELAESYLLRNWESGVLSGIRYAYNKSKHAPVPIVLHLLEGRLHSADMPALAVAATVCALDLFGQPDACTDFIPDSWTFRGIETRSPAEANGDAGGHPETQSLTDS